MDDTSFAKFILALDEHLQLFRRAVTLSRPKRSLIETIQRGGHYALYQTLLWALADAAKRAGCSCAVTPHRLRHTFASEMVRLGVRSGRINGHCMSRSASCTPNVWYRPMTTFGVQLAERDMQ